VRRAATFNGEKILSVLTRIQFSNRTKQAAVVRGVTKEKAYPISTY
jgi:hypothetical protein